MRDRKATEQNDRKERKKWELSGCLHLAIISNWEIITCFLKVGLRLREQERLTLISWIKMQCRGIRCPSHDKLFHPSVILARSDTAGETERWDQDEVCRPGDELGLFLDGYPPLSQVPSPSLGCQVTIRSTRSQGGQRNSRTKRRCTGHQGPQGEPPLLIREGSCLFQSSTSIQNVFSNILLNNICFYSKTRYDSCNFGVVTSVQFVNFLCRTVF